MKIILYCAWGGFHLTAEMLDLYHKKTGIWLMPLLHQDADRTDPVLIEVIKEFDHDDDYKVIDIPKGTEYIVEAYDGNEYLTFKDEVKWQVAT